MAQGDPEELFYLKGLGFLCLLLNDALRSILPSSFPVLPYTSTLLFDAGHSWPPSNSGFSPEFPSSVVKCILVISAWMSLSQTHCAHKIVFSVAHPLLKCFSQLVLSSIYAQGILGTVFQEHSRDSEDSREVGAIPRDLSIVCRSLVGAGQAMQR